MPTRKVLSRRDALRGLGVSMALPALEAMAPRTLLAARSAPPPVRLVAVNIPLGFHGPSFFPAAPGADYPMSPTLKPAEALRTRFTVVSGTSHPGVDGGHEAEKSFLTAAPHPGSRSFRNTVSLDQWIARRVGERTRHASLTLGEHSLSWSPNGVNLPAVSEPREAFARLFLQGSAQDIAAQKRRLEDGRSIMDAVLEDAKAMERTLGPADREKLEQYLTAVREAEQRLAKADAWAAAPKPAVKSEPPAPVRPEDVVGRLAGHLEVTRLAFMSDSTRVVAIGGHGGSLVPPFKGVDQGYHALTHHGKNPVMISQLEIIDRETIRAWAAFLDSLLKTPEEGGTLLDRTCVLLGSNLGNANAHLTGNLPVLLAGGPFRHGSHLAFDPEKNAPLPKLFVSLIRALGLEGDSFAGTSGTLPGLEPRG